MQTLHLCSQVHWLSVLVATFSAFALGSLWYSKLLFGTSWQELSGLTREKMQQANMGVIFGTTFVLNFIGALVLDIFLGPDASLSAGLRLGLTISLVWIASSFAINYLYTLKPLKLFLIDAGYFVVFYAVEGTILGAW